MDGHFVPNLTIGPPLVRALKRVACVPLDVHLMIDNPAEQLDWFIETGADLITLPIECAGGVDAPLPQPGESRHIWEVTAPELLHTLISRVHTAGRKAGLSLNPGTPVETIIPFLRAIDVVLVMSVHPGFGGQSFIPQTTEKIAALAAAIRGQGLSTLIEVDGGITVHTAPLVVAAGATILVAGNAVFGADDPQAALLDIRTAAHRHP
jgi:ribulose-phosphate 3-epimerase